MSPRTNTLSGVFLGVTDFPSPHTPVVYQGEGHVATIALPRTGKSASVCGPNHVIHEGSLISVDSKGELSDKFALYRQEVLGIPNRVFDPFGVVDERILPTEKVVGDDSVERVVPVRGHCDPVDFIRRSKAPLSAAYRVAEAFIPSGRSQKDPYWEEGAQNYFAAILLFVATDPAMDEICVDIQILTELNLPHPLRRDMRTVWAFLSNAEAESMALFFMKESSIGLISDQGSMFFEAAPDDTGVKGVRNHLRTNVARTLGEPGVLDSLTGTNVDFSSMSRVPQSVFITLPGIHAQTQFRFIRVILMMALGDIEESGLRAGDATTPVIRVEVDEMDTLGKFMPMVEAMGRMAGYGLRFHLYALSLGQIKATYGEDFAKIMGNIDCLQYFGGTNEHLTGEFLSTLSGKHTRGTVSENVPSQGMGASRTYSEAGRQNYMPDEVMNLPLPKQLIKIAGREMAQAEIIGWQLREFPVYREFMRLVEGGVDPKEAARVAKRVAPYQPPRPAPTVATITEAPRGPRFSIMKALDQSLARFMGHDED